ncbi:MAG: hypothetical protein NVV83_10490 [Afipia sp.]|nr:hypothetical protein [Afipia sp.]
MPGAEKETAAAAGDEAAAAELPDVDGARGRNEGISMTLPRGFEFVSCCAGGALLALVLGAFLLGLG